MIHSQKEGCTFAQFSTYSKLLEAALNQQPHFSAKYIIKPGKFLREHDAEYLEILFHKDCTLIKINLVYSLAFRIPDLLFMVYEDGKPLNKDATFELIHQARGEEVEELKPSNEVGIFLTQNPISENTFFCLHGCQVSLGLKYLVPFYLSLLGLHPAIEIDAVIDSC